MKANAPEKIYVQLPSRNWIGNIWNETPIKEGDTPNWKNATNIEYIRTDAFIEKAVDYIANNMRCNGYTLQTTKTKFIRDFKEYLKK